VQGYFPAIVSEDDFYKAQRAIDGRQGGGGRVTGTPNLFNGYLWCALDNERMVLNGTRGRKTLVSSGAIRKRPGSVWRQVGYAEFEAAVLSLLRELRPEDVVGKARPGEDVVKALSGRLAALNHNITKTQQRAGQADDPTVFLDLLEDLGRQRKEAIGQLEKAKAEAADPVSDNLGECSSLITLLEEAEEDERDDLRRRTRAAIRRLVDSAWVLVVPRGKKQVVARGKKQLVALQLWFRGGKEHRDYLIYARQGRWSARSLAEVVKAGDLDLRWPEDARRPEDVAALEAKLAALDLAGLAAGGPRAGEGEHG
jgi:hypothetical protein